MKVNVGVFYGGPSVEHEISIISAMQVISILDTNKYKPIPIYISKENDFYTGETLLNIENYSNTKEMLKKCDKIFFTQDDSGTKYITKKSKFSILKNIDRIDVAFPVLHGKFGEDGGIQGLFEYLKLPYTGCNVATSALCMDKVLCKKVLNESGIPVIEYDWFYSNDWISNEDKIINSIEKKLKYPLIIKPSNGGSSIGITVAKNRGELIEGIEETRRYSSKVIVEVKLENIREINCSVIGDGLDYTTSVCEEPIAADKILSFQDKYLSGGKTKGMGSAKRVIPAQISEEIEKKIREFSGDAFSIIEGSGVIRIDFILDPKSNKIYLNEINTLPGSLAFYLWEKSSLNFTALVDKLIEIGYKRERDRKNLISSFETNVLNGFKGSKGVK